MAVDDAPIDPDELRRQLAAARLFIDDHRLAPSTRRTYGSHFKAFRRWCERNGLVALPVEVDTLVWWALDRLQPVVAADGTICLDGVHPNTVRTALAAIAYHHEREAVTCEATRDPALGDVLHAAEALCKVPPQKARPFTIEILREIDRAPRHRRGRTWQRDRDLVVFGTFAAFRADDLRRLHTSHLNFVDAALIVYVPSSNRPVRARRRGRRRSATR